MKSLCITGSSATSVAAVAEILNLAGLAPAKAIQHGTSIDMFDWHERVVPLLRAGQPMGRLWEKAAEELLLVNLSDHAWGWHSPLSLWALEFWADLEPSIHFLLVTESPEAHLARAWLAEGRTADTEALLEEWRVQHARMLEFYLSHPERCLLVEAGQASMASDKLIELLEQRWQLLEVPSTGLPTEASTECSMPMRLAVQLAEPVCSQYAERLDTLRHELEAATYPLDSLGGSDTADSLPLIEALQQFQQLSVISSRYDQQARELEQTRGEVTRLEEAVSRQARQKDELLATNREVLLEKAALEQQVATLEQSTARLRTELQSAHQRLEEKAAWHQKEQSTLLDERKGLVRELTEAREQAARLTAFEQSQAALRDEYEALLLSLHGTQEQLEASLARHQEEQARFTQEKESLLRELDQAYGHANRLEQSESQQAALREDYESLHLSLHDTQETLERVLARRQKEQADHMAERESLQEALRDAQAVAEQHSVAAQTSAEKHTVAQREAERLSRECEALLVSLHQTQESLEGRLRQYASQQASMQALHQRLIALKQRAGPAFAADAVEVSLSGSSRMEWRLANLLVGEAEYPSLAIGATLAGGNLQLEVKPGDNEAWRLDLARPVTLNTLLPAQRELAGSLPGILQAHLPDALGSGRRRRWQRAFDKLAQSLEALPPRLSFDTPELHHVQVNPDYEHLWITLPQASFAGSEPKRWQFRLSCANVTPEAFGTQPKLEIPRQQAQLLEGWFQESQDSFGEKLELRFALPKAMDGGVWKRLRPHDQRLLQSLMTSLPDILSSLEQQGHHTGRDWREWHRLAVDMRRILQARVV